MSVSIRAFPEEPSPMSATSYPRIASQESPHRNRKGSEQQIPSREIAPEGNTQPAGTGTQHKNAVQRKAPETNPPSLALFLVLSCCMRVQLARRRPIVRLSSPCLQIAVAADGFLATAQPCAQPALRSVTTRAITLMIRIKTVTKKAAAKASACAEAKGSVMKVQIT